MGKKLFETMCGIGLVNALRRAVFRPVLLSATLALFGMAAQGEASCRVALALGLDVSDLVDGAEYRLQLDGLASALTRPEVVAAFLADPEAEVRMFVYEWAGADSQRRIIDWSVVRSAADLQAVAETLRLRPRIELVPSTGLGEAMLYGVAALSAQPDCHRHVLDISGDGKSNAGVLPRDLSSDALGGVTVNGLVVGTRGIFSGEQWWTEITDVHEYYTTDVIRGPGAFAMTATSYSDFEDAMARKLLRELQSFALARPLHVPVCAPAGGKGSLDAWQVGDRLRKMC